MIASFPSAGAPRSQGYSRHEDTLGSYLNAGIVACHPFYAHAESACNTLPKWGADRITRVGLGRCTANRLCGRQAVPTPQNGAASLLTKREEECSRSA